MTDLFDDVTILLDVDCQDMGGMGVNVETPVRVGQHIAPSQG